MSAVVLDGFGLAERLRTDVRAGVESFKSRYGRVPSLDVVLVGDDPASEVYTRSKERASNEVGMRGTLHKLDATIKDTELYALLERLNADDDVDGILVQLPLPPQIPEKKVLDFVLPAKDVDGLHPLNVGLLASGRPGIIPCTPLGCMRLLELAKFSLEGARALVIGRSNIVGKPLAQLLLAQHATVTIAHSKTKDLPGLCREADVLVAAVGCARLIRGDWVKEGAVVIDVGINRERMPGGKTRLVGDVCFDEAKERASAITPVPRGVGPMTIVALLLNTLRAATLRRAGADDGA